MAGEDGFEPISDAAPAGAERAQWAAPRMILIAAGEAEAGTSGAIPDGPYAPGS
jgi:hypothetical protein